MTYWRLQYLTFLSIGSVTCPKGYTHYKQDKFCFKFYTECKSWLEAKRACQQNGGDLISLKENNSDFFKEFVRLQEGKCAPHVWGGTTDVSSKGLWYWLNGEKVSSIFWIRGQPDNSDANEYCGELRSEHGNNLNNRNCVEKNNFLCQIVN